MRQGGYDYDSYSRLAGPLTEPDPVGYRVRYRSLLSKEPHRVRAVLLMCLAPILSALLLAYLVWPGHRTVREGGDRLLVHLDTVMLVSIALICFFMLVNVISITHATMVARDPIPVHAEKGTRVAFLTTYVPGKEPLSMVRATLEGAHAAAARRTPRRLAPRRGRLRRGQGPLRRARGPPLHPRRLSPSGTAGRVSTRRGPSTATTTPGSRRTATTTTTSPPWTPTTSRSPTSWSGCSATSATPTSPSSWDRRCTATTPTSSPRPPSPSSSSSTPSSSAPGTATTRPCSSARTTPSGSPRSGRSAACTTPSPRTWPPASNCTAGRTRPPAATGAPSTPPTSSRWARARPPGRTSSRSSSAGPGARTRRSSSSTGRHPSALRRAASSTTP